MEACQSHEERRVRDQDRGERWKAYGAREQRYSRRKGREEIRTHIKLAGRQRSGITAGCDIQIPLPIPAGPHFQRGWSVRASEWTAGVGADSEGMPRQC